MVRSTGPEAGGARPRDRAPRDRARRFGNLLNLSTPIGLAVARVGGARLRPGPRGLILGEGYRLPFPVAGAFTVGDVVITSSTWTALLARHPRLLEHEERHSWQYLACLGLPYLVPYVAAMAWSVLRTGDRASANVFERHAGLVDGGYRERPVRPPAEVVAAVAGRLGRRARRD